MLPSAWKNQAAAAQNGRFSPDLPFAEVNAWRSVGAGWKQLFGNFQSLGFSFEWHDFTTKETLDWGRSFHPGSLEICLNLIGDGFVQVGKTRTDFGPFSAGFYRQAGTPLEARRLTGQEHQFITIEFSPQFLAHHLNDYLSGLHPLVSGMIQNHSNDSGCGPAHRLTSDQQQLIHTLRHPPVATQAQKLWYQSKALELTASFLFQPQNEEFFCDRQKRLSQDRVEKVISILRNSLTDPPTLEELGKKIGCSHFYLSRTFSKEAGMTIPQYLRQMRMEKAAELLKSGKYNVTEAAMEVGYSSLSHFSQAFHETYGCCPGLYPLAPNHVRQKAK